MISSFYPSVKLVLPHAGHAFSGTGYRRYFDEEPVSAEQALANLFECEYCEHGELEAVARHGQAIVPSLITTLIGPSAAIRENLRGDLQARYGQLVEQSKRTHMRPSPRPKSNSSSSIWAISMPNIGCARRRRWQ